MPSWTIRKGEGTLTPSKCGGHCLLVWRPNKPRCPECPRNAGTMLRLHEGLAKMPQTFNLVLILWTTSARSVSGLHSCLLCTQSATSPVVLLDWINDLHGDSLTHQSGPRRKVIHVAYSKLTSSIFQSYTAHHPDKIPRELYVGYTTQLPDKACWSFSA